MRTLMGLRVAIIGVGGVGSWCAEALVRTGVRNLTIVDDDVVAESNVNRQLEATTLTLGFAKVDALASRLREVSPEASVQPVRMRWAQGCGFSLDSFDCVIDAIDSVVDKASLIRTATSSGVEIFSSMGAALRVDPTKVRVSDFKDVGGDGLARALRQRFKKDGQGPAPSFKCVHSTEPPRDLPVRGSVMPVTAAFGMALASLVINGYN